MAAAINAGCAALNAGLYIADGQHWWSAAAAGYGVALALICLALKRAQP